MASQPKKSNLAQEHFRRATAEKQIEEIKSRYDIADYVREQGYELEAHGPHKLHLKVHDSLVLDLERQTFRWYSQQKYGDILALAQLDLATGAEIRTPSEARRELYRALHTAGLSVIPHRTAPPPVRDPPKRQPLVPPEPGSKYWKRIYAYLIHQRGLSPGVVQWLSAENLIYPDQRGNLVYLERDASGTATYAAKKSTLPGSHFRWVDPSSDFSARCGWLFGQKPTVLFVTEAAVDAWSVMSLLADAGTDYKQFAYLSLECCFGGPLVQRLKDNPQIKTVYFCQDADEAGMRSRTDCRRLLAEAGFEHLQLIDRLPPSGKDWNEALQNQRIAERMMILDMENEQQALQVTLGAGKVTANGILSAIRWAAQHAASPHVGKQSVKQLARHDRELAQIEIPDEQIKAVQRQLKDYGVDFAVMQQKQDGKVTNTSLWFKAQDHEVINTALQNVIKDLGKKPAQAQAEKSVAQVRDDATRTAESINAEKAVQTAQRGQQVL